jgi:hypothetical protein
MGKTFLPIFIKIIKIYFKIVVKFDSLHHILGNITKIDAEWEEIWSISGLFVLKNSTEYL